MRKSLPVLALLFLACCLLMPLPVLAGSSGISGCAWIDSGSGLYEGGGRGQGGVNVSLYRLEADGSEVRLSTTATDSKGQYSFTGLDAGQYRLRAKAPDSCGFIVPREGGSVMLPAVGTASDSLPIQLA